MQTLGLLLSGPMGLAASRSDLSAFAEHDFRVKAVVSETPGLLESYIEETTENLRYQGFEISTLEKLMTEATFLICVGWRRLIPQEFPLENCFVVHDSLLPALRGWNPLVSAVELGLAKTGVTLIQAGKNPDTGPVLGQKSFQLGTGVSIGEAISYAQPIIEELLQEFASDFENNRRKGVPQDESLASLSPWRDSLDYRIDWSKPAREVQQFVLSRGFPYQGAQSTIDGKKVIVRVASERTDFPELVIRSPGKVIAIENGRPIVACGEGFLEIVLFDAETKREILQERTRVRLV